MCFNGQIFWVKNHVFLVRSDDLWNPFLCVCNDQQFGTNKLNRFKRIVYIFGRFKLIHSLKILRAARVVQILVRIFVVSLNASSTSVTLVGIGTMHWIKYKSINHWPDTTDSQVRVSINSFLSFLGPWSTTLYHKNQKNQQQNQ